MAKPQLVLLHGALGAKSQFEPWLPLLEDNFQIHCLDFEGHGSQPFSDRQFAIAHFAENLSDFLTQHDIQKANIFGYSMGGYVALYLASRQPERFAKIFTFASKFHWTPESAEKEAKMLDVETILKKVPKFADMLAKRHYGNDWQGHLSRTALMMKALGESPALGPNDFANVLTPTRLGIGDRDKMVTFEETVTVYRQIQGAEFQVLPQTPHPLEKIDPERICQEITSYFSA